MEVRKKIAIIGAGASGITSIKCCLDEDLIPVCFEKDDELGGLWNYSDEVKPGKGGIYHSCVINTCKEMMAYSDFPVPEDFPPFMPHHYVLDYFRRYTQHFGLEDYIKFGITVENIYPADSYEITGRWIVAWRRTESIQCDINVEVFDGVMVCTGHHVFPSIPTFLGLENFRGIKMHSQDYKRPSIATDKKVLVVGLGNSAVDIATDVTTSASSVSVSTRHGAWIIGRVGPFGVPADALANSRFMFSLPLSWLQVMVEWMASFRFSHGNYGVSPLHRSLQAHPTLTDYLPVKILEGKVVIRPDIHHFTPDGVVYDNGIEEKVDVVIFATGYNYMFTCLDETVVKVEKNEADLYKYMFPPLLNHPSLAIIGFVQAIGSVIPISEIQARWYTKLMKSGAKLPSKECMLQDIKSKREKVQQQYTKSSRHTIQTFWISYMDEIANQFGVKPDLRKLFIEDPFLAMRCFFGPCIPAQYRLTGHGKWDGAKQAIKSSLSNLTQATKTRKIAEPAGKRTLWHTLTWCLVKFVVVYIVMYIFCKS